MWEAQKSALAVALLVAGTLVISPVRGAARLDPRRLPPSTQPHASKYPLPPDLAVLGQRSLFSRNGVPAAVVDAAAPKPEAAMALRGITLDENSFVAFIEDTISHRTLTLHAGEGVAGGRIRTLNLDELAFEMGSKVIPIRVGQNLLGGMMPVAVAPPAQPPAAGPPPGAAGPPPGAVQIMEAPPGSPRKRAAPAEAAPPPAG